MSCAAVRRSVIVKCLILYRYSFLSCSQARSFALTMACINQSYHKVSFVLHHSPWSLLSMSAKNWRGPGSQLHTTITLLLPCVLAYEYCQRSNETLWLRAHRICWARQWVGKALSWCRCRIEASTSMGCYLRSVMLWKSIIDWHVLAYPECQ